MKENDITAHTCSKCSTIYCEYSPGLAQEAIDSVSSLLGSIVDAAKYMQRRVEQKYTEDDMISFATNMMDEMADVTGLEATKEDLKQWKG